MITLLYSGNFGLGHELGTILRAVSMLSGDANLKLLLVGNGKGLAETHRLVEELGLPNVEFRPPVPMCELPKLLRTGDIHLVAQRPRTEGLIVPSKIYGTLAVGRPVIFVGPEHCEVAQIIRDSRCGFVVAPGNVASAAKAMRELALNEDLRCQMGQQARRYYVERLGCRRSVGRIIDLIERIGGKDRLDRQEVSLNTGRSQLASGRRDRRPIVAALAATLLMLVVGLGHHALAARLGGSPISTRIAPDALERFPMQIGSWVGQDVPMDEAIVRATDTDAHINRRYSRYNTQESVSLYVACGTNVTRVLGHRPQLCYPRAGWTLTRRDSVELSLDDGTKLPCTVLGFSRGYPAAATIVVLHYYIVDGRPRDDIAAAFSDIGRRFAAVGCVAQVQIIASSEASPTDSAMKRVFAFAVDSASSITELFENIPTDRKANSPCTPQRQADHL